MTRIAIAIILLAACSKSKEQAAPPPSPSPDTAAVAAVALDAADPSEDEAEDEPDEAAPDEAEPDEDESAPPPGRCTIGGDPLIVPCVGGGSFAATGAHVYLTSEKGVHRYRRTDEDGCVLEVDTKFGTKGVLAPPVKEPKPQTLGERPLVMRSGPPRWNVTAAGGAVYLHEILLGLYRIDRGSLQPVCPDLLGADKLAIHGATALLSTEGGQKLDLGKKCKSTPHKFDPRASFGLHAIGPDTWGQTGSGKLTRYDAAGKAVATAGSGDAFKPGGLCSIVAATACNGDVCLLDTNCKKVSRFAADGTHRVERKVDELIGHTPYSVTGLALDANDDYYLAATEKDGETCEASLYVVPSAVLEP